MIQLDVLTKLDNENKFATLKPLLVHNLQEKVLKIRLTRTGKTRQESFRIVVAEHTNAVKGKYVELLGYYQPANKPKVVKFDKERIEYWIKKGAKPSSTVATILKAHSFANMDQYLEKRTTKIKKKDAKAAATAKPAAAVAAKPAEKPAAKPAPEAAK